jgi:hypothetical protein
MTTNDSKPVTLRINEIHSLADRLENRGELKIGPERPNDLRLAARVIRALALHFNHTDTVTINGD